MNGPTTFTETFLLTDAVAIPNSVRFQDISCTGGKVVSSNAQLAAQKFTAALNIGQEVPRPKGAKASASGRFRATLTGKTLKWTLTFAHLTGKATASHIHSGVRGKRGPVLVALCGRCTSRANGTATVTAAEIKSLLAGKDYVNVHTAKNANGEIRGQITHAN